MSEKLQRSRAILYLGADTRYRNRLEQRFKESYPMVGWTFPTIDFSEIDADLGIQSIFMDVIKELPRIVYLDFSEGENDELFFLAELLSRDRFFKHIPICGLVENKERVRSCLNTGADLIMVKGIEMFDAINTPMAIAFPKIVKPVNFAKAQVAKKVQLFDDFRIGYISDKHIHVESNFPLEEGEIIHLETDIPFKTVPSKNYLVKKKSSEDLYYDFLYSYDFAYQFVDMPDLEEIEDEGEKSKAKAEHKTRLEWCQRKHKEWVQFSVDGSEQKDTKILIVDKSMRVLSEKGTGDIRKLPFGFRFQTSLDEELNIVSKIKPLIICYQMYGMYEPEHSEILKRALETYQTPEDTWQLNTIAQDEEEKIYNNMLRELKEHTNAERDLISRLIAKVKEIPDYNPIIILCGDSLESAEALQETYLYNLITVQKESMNMETINKLGHGFSQRRKAKFEKIVQDKVAALKKKDPVKFRKLSASDFKDIRYFIKKANHLSNGSMAMDITIKAMSESELLFSTDKLLPHKTYRMNYPIPMSIHLVTNEGGQFVKNGDMKTYRALIHSIDESDKQKLREEVNNVFFTPLREKREQEKEEFFKRNEEERLKRERELLAGEEGEEGEEGPLSPESEVLDALPEDHQDQQGQQDQPEEAAAQENQTEDSE